MFRVVAGQPDLLGAFERGFDQTTAAEIAVRAGVNERTLQRAFDDLRTLSTTVLSGQTQAGS
ncbi:TetR family transcriptional regulator [Amycolatopsis pithecellobii]|uniref:TetR family transcriptional regulator n=1 Tax=Amycolatopsis pithecellobii TaxID=664692 RepID=UPI001AA0631E|nr:TetR family transcriptional regulator [Amycolatopsis pithecellobii]